MKTRTLSVDAKTAVPTRASQPFLPVLPQYIRLPKQGTLCPWTGLSRGKLNDLILPRPATPTPPVRSINTAPAKSKGPGCRLIVLQSLLDYLKKLEREQGAE